MIRFDPDMSLSVAIGNFLYRNAFPLYKPLYTLFKNRQDAFEISLLEKYVRKNDVVLDIGANIGFYALILSKLVGEKGLVHCFEPDATNFRHLRNTTGSLKNVGIHQKAVGPKTEKIKIYTSRSLNVDHRTYKPEEYDQELEIEAVSIDDHLGKGNKADLIKMDIQGFEMQAVAGMQKTLDSNPGIKIISEFWPYGLRSAGSSVSEYYKFLEDKGFEVFLLKENRLEKLSAQKVKDMEGLGKEIYFNIFAQRPNV